MSELETLIKKSFQVKNIAANLSAERKNSVLSDISAALKKESGSIIDANKKDYADAKESGTLAQAVFPDIGWAVRRRIGPDSNTVDLRSAVGGIRLRE